MPKPLILIAEDFSDGREMIAEYLRFEGFDVLEAVDGEQALELARKHHPGVILMDLSMPTLDGWEATRLLKRDPATRDIVVIALTAHALKHEEDSARAAGCDGFLTKPTDLYTLADTLHRVLEKGPGALNSARSKRAKRRAAV